VPRPAGIDLLDRAWTKKHLPRRPVDANKGTFGKVMTVAGSQSYVGAASLAAAGAYRAGAGLVCLAVPRSIQPLVAARVAEAIFLLVDEQDGALTAAGAASVRDSLEGYATLLVGCGLGAAAAESVRVLLLNLEHDLRGVVIDADGLNALAATADWHGRLPRNSVLTPHPGEMSRLCGMAVADIQAAKRRGSTRPSGASHWCSRVQTR
jgi:NAD(P)H-hydrate epimerase